MLLIRILLLTFLMFFSSNVCAQKMPAKITLLFPWIAGDAHLFVNSFIPVFSKAMGVPVELKIVRGKFGHVALSELAKSPADGSTLFFGTTSDLIQRLIGEESLPPLWNEMELIDLVAYQALGCILSPGSQFQDIHQVVAAIKSKKTVIKLMNPSRIGLIFPAYMLRQFGLTLNDVKFKTYDLPLTLDQAILLEPNLLVCLSVNSILQKYNGSQFIHLITNSSTPIPAAPRLVLARNVGAKSLEDFRYWSMLVAPKGTPKAVTNKIRSVLKKMAQDPEWVSVLNSFVAVPASNKVPNLQKFMQEEWQFFERVAILSRWIE